jgi:hypothetical protein
VDAYSKDERVAVALVAVPAFVLDAISTWPGVVAGMTPRF